MSVRAECVMLNKGDYILGVLLVPGNILYRMEAHQQITVYGEFLLLNSAIFRGYYRLRIP